MSVKSLKAYLVLAVMCGGASAWANITVTFSEGDLPKIERYGSATGQPNVLFDDVTVSVDTTISGCLILPGRGTRTYVDSRTQKTEDLVDFYGCVVDNGGGTLKLTGLNRLDSETYYFRKDYEAKGQDTLTADLANRTDPLWAYTFTGWYIENSTPLATNLQYNPTHVPAQTVFQPGDVITPQVLAKNGIITSGQLHLVALWGKCCFVSGNGTLSNLGNDPNTPCTLDSVVATTTHIADRFCNYDAYMQVAMLVGNDTIQGAYNDSYYGITYKSLQTTDGRTYEFYKKHYGDRTYNYKSQGNYRLDNIYMTHNYRHTMTTYSPYVEITARLNMNMKVAQCMINVANEDKIYSRVQVANGGKIYDRIGTSTYQEEYAYIGRKASVFTSMGIRNKNAYVYCTGGGEGIVCGPSANATGSFNVYCYGDSSNNSEYDPYPSPVMCNSSKEPLPNANLYINGCSRLKTIFGGGYEYYAKVENVNLQIYNSRLSGNVFVGGLYGSVLVQAKAIIKNTTIQGNVYGCASGATSTSSYVPSLFGMKVDTLHAPTGFPRFMTTPVGTHPAYTVFSFLQNYIEAYNGNYDMRITSCRSGGSTYYLSLAQASSVDIELENCTIGTAKVNPDSIWKREHGNIYGGGAIAQVLGDVKIKVKDCTVYSNIYGGGDGITVPATFAVDFPLDSMQATYIPPSSIEVWQKRKTSTQHPYSGTSMDPEDYVTDKYGRRLYGRRKYQWSFDPAVLAMGGFDHDRMLAYSPNGGGWGDVQGSTNVSVTGGTVYGSIYGGGNAGRVGYAGVDSITGHGTTLTVDGTTVEGDVYGGCNQANVGGSINLTVSPGTVVKGGVYSGNNMSGTIAGDVTSTISANAKTVYGGGYGEKTNVGGSVNLTVSGSTVTGDVYAGSALGNVNAKYDTDSVLVATSGATTNVTLTNNTINGNVYGGCLGQRADTTATDTIKAIEAKVFGPVTVQFNSGTLTGNLFGCNNQNGAPQDSVLVNINGGTVTGNVYGGGNQAAYTAPDSIPNYPVVNVIGGTLGSVFGGGLGSTAIVTGNPQVSVSNGSTVTGSVFGGGDGGNVKGCTNVKITGATTKVNDSVFGGGNNAAVSGPTNVQVGGQ